MHPILGRSMFDRQSTSNLRRMQTMLTERSQAKVQEGAAGSRLFDIHRAIDLRGWMISVGLDWFLPHGGRRQRLLQLHT